MQRPMTVPSNTLSAAKHRHNPTALIALRRLTGLYPIFLLQRATGAN